MNTEKVLLIGIGYTDDFSCSCVVELSKGDDPIQVLLDKKELTRLDVDEVLVIRKGFEVQHMTVDWV